MIALNHADVYYGEAQALQQVSISAASGEIVALIGRNGAGKSTTLRTLAGWQRARGPALVLNGRHIEKATPELLSRLGVTLVPEDRQIFPTLTVEENLRIALVAHRPSRWKLQDIFDLFPRLGERRRAHGAALSGGEQQMLAIGRGLLCQPSVLLLDEPTEGLSPVMCESVVQAIRAIGAQGIAIVLVEQNARIPKQLAHRFCVLDSGRVVWSGDCAELERDGATVDRLLSV